MKKLLACMFASTMILAFSVGAQAATIYTNYLSYLAAFPNPTVENFVDPTLEPGLSIWTNSAINQIAYGVYQNRVSLPEPTGLGEYTVFTHSSGFNAFGGWFDLYNPGGAGTNIDVYYIDPNTSLEVFAGTISNTYNGGFWGFSTGQLFNDVVFRAGTGSGWAETYMSVDLEYSAVPEPSTLLLLGFGLVGVAGLARKVRK